MSGRLQTDSRVTVHKGLGWAHGDKPPFFETLDRDIALHLADVKAYKSGIVELRHEVRGPRG